MATVLDMLSDYASQINRNAVLAQENFTVGWLMRSGFQRTPFGPEKYSGTKGGKGS